MIFRQLHNERRGLAGEKLGFLQHDARDDNRHNAHEVEQRSNPPGIVGIARCQRAEHKRDNRHLRTARNHGGGHDGHAAIHLIFDGLGRHNSRHAAARRDKHGDERLAGKAELAEHAVHDEGDARHIAAQL